MCTKPVRRSNINLSKSNFDRICDDVGITSSYALTPNEGLVIYNFYNLPLPRVCISWQTAQTHFAASHLGLCCLYIFLFRMHSSCSTSANFKASYTPARQICYPTTFRQVGYPRHSARLVTLDILTDWLTSRQIGYLRHLDKLVTLLTFSHNDYPRH